MTADDRQRIDKWLWYARIVRTRTGAQRLAVSGRVRINRDKNDSASKSIRAGDVLTIALEAGVRVLRVASPGARRGPPEEARLLYVDLSPQPAPRAADEARPGGARPTKRDRRTFEALREQAASSRDIFSPDDD